MKEAAWKAMRKIWKENKEMKYEEEEEKWKLKKSMEKGGEWMTVKTEIYNGRDNENMPLEILVTETKDKYEYINKEK